MITQLTQHIYDLVGLCAEFGVEKAIVCPGSRCAPLLIGFGKHPVIETISVTDERSAGFVGLGMAQQSGKPVVLVCTSGTAALNFAPAVTEAFYQNVPLIVLTADRPPEWIDQWDGQTIRQNNLYADHVKGSYIFDKNNVAVAETAFKLALDRGQGPVHLNIPIREPFYLETNGKIIFNAKPQRPQKFKKYKIDEAIWNEFESLLKSSEKVMFLGGQMEPNLELVALLNKLEFPVLGDVISNLHGVDEGIQSIDLMFETVNKTMALDFLITFGRSVVSKNLKLYLRKYKPKHHWHIGEGMVGDPFKALSKTIEMPSLQFFKKWSKINAEKITKVEKGKSNYFILLSEAQKKVDKNLNSKLENSEFNYFSAVQKIIQNLPEKCELHLGNSMPVRIANFIGIKNPTINVWCNRGTSGIDGVVSTAVGHALAEPAQKHVLIIGDLSFFYDRNGLWLNHKFPRNIRIVILNDNGGGIFNMISEASSQGNLTELFTTPHQRTAKLTAQEFGLEYRSAKSLEEITGWKSGVLEIFTDMELNTNFFKKL
jgi:2-succinyl-5-enolpyruvyl-6-hydroxy-3-cyclohexene-1-carboxylate synthase